MRYSEDGVGASEEMVEEMKEICAKDLLTYAFCIRCRGVE